MPSWCVIRGCQAKQGGAHVSHHRVPKDYDTGLQWLRLAGREDIIEKGYDYWIKKVVCSAHFEDHCFLNPAKTKLIRHLPVFPSLHMGLEEAQSGAKAPQDGPEALDEPDVDISDMPLEPQVDLHTTEDYMADGDAGEDRVAWPEVTAHEEEYEGDGSRKDPNRPSHMDDDEYQKKIQETLDYIKRQKSGNRVKGAGKRGGDLAVHSWTDTNRAGAGTDRRGHSSSAKRPKKK